MDVKSGGNAQAVGTSSDADAGAVIKWFWGVSSAEPLFQCALPDYFHSYLHTNVRACLHPCCDAAGDSANGSQDTWVEYDSAASSKFEAARQAGKDEVKVDDERFIDLEHMFQRRYDDVNKRRTIKRTETKKRAAPIATGRTSPGRKKRRVGDAGRSATAADDAGAGIAAAGAAGGMSPVGPSAVGHLALPNVPDDWDSFDSLDYFEVNVDKGSAEFDWISKIVHETTEDAHTMNDFNHKIKFRRLEIVKIMRVQNPSTWMAYNSFREQIIRSAYLLPLSAAYAERRKLRHLARSLVHKAVLGVLT